MNKVQSAFPLERIPHREQVLAYSIDDGLHVIIDPRSRIVAEDEPEMRTQIRVGAFDRENTTTLGEKCNDGLPILIDIPEKHHEGYFGFVNVIHNGIPYDMQVKVWVSDRKGNSFAYQKNPLSCTPSTIEVCASTSGRYIITVPYSESEREAVRQLSGQGELTEHELGHYRFIMQNLLHINRREFRQQKYQELLEEAKTFHRRYSEMRVLILDSDLGVIVSTEVPSIESPRGKYLKEYRAETNPVERFDQFMQMHPFDYGAENAAYLALFASFGINPKATTKWGELANEMRRLMSKGVRTDNIQEGDAIVAGPDMFGESTFYTIRTIKEKVPCQSRKVGYLCDVGIEIAARETSGLLTLEERMSSEVYVNAWHAIIRPGDPADKLLPMKRISRVSMDTLLSDLREFSTQQRMRHQYGTDFPHNQLYEACIRSIGLNFGFFGRT